MSKSTTTGLKHISQKRNTRHVQEDNTNKVTERQQARKFITWYKRMIDDERQNLCLYLADDAILEWFGRTIKTRKKVAAFLKHDMQCSSHDFTTVESIEKIQIREDRVLRHNDAVSASVLNSLDVTSSKSGRSVKRKILRSECDSPEWAEGCEPQEEDPKGTEIKRMETHIESQKFDQKTDTINHRNGVKRRYSGDDTEINSKGDGVLGRRIKRKCVPVTPPNCEVGQGDCLPSTSGTADSDRSHDTLNAQLPKLAVECNGYVEFTRSKNNRPSDTRKWERNCKLQISYSEDPLNIGEYILWALLYTDESKCRRNLLSAFEEVAKEEELKKCTD